MGTRLQEGARGLISEPPSDYNIPALYTAHSRCLLLADTNKAIQLAVSTSLIRAYELLRSFLVFGDNQMSKECQIESL